MVYSNHFYDPTLNSASIYAINKRRLEDDMVEECLISCVSVD